MLFPSQLLVGKGPTVFSCYQPRTWNHERGVAELTYSSGITAESGGRHGVVAQW